MSYYKYHVFFCTNQRAPGESCCNNHDSLEMCNYMRSRVKEVGNRLPHKVRINTAGCMNRCDLGPVLVVYPEAIWYTFVDQKDIDDVIDNHLIAGQPVKRLMLA